MYKLEDILILENILECIPEPEEGRYSPGHLIAEVGKFFLEAPYADKTLEGEGPEKLMVNLVAFDCFTFVENCLALSLLITSRRQSWNEYIALLTRIRYRDGVLNGYASRLHYYSDWLQDNVRKGLLQDVTKNLGGIHFAKDINYMTGHPDLYPPLSDPDIARQMAEAEKQLTSLSLYISPVSIFDDQEQKIREGDLIGITSATEGLDVMHAGLALYEGDSVHLLHASRQAGKVIISAEPLAHYLRENEARTGIMVGRIRKD